MKQHKYYIDSADLTVIAEDTRFKIHSHFLTRESSVFREQIGRLEVPLVAIGDHAAPAAVNPIVLDASVKADHFGKLLSVFYPDKYIYDKPAEDWDIILALAIKWSFDEVRDLCIRELSKDNVPIALRLAIFEANNLDDNIVHPLYSILCTSEQPLTLPDMERLGIRASYIIMTARECLRSPGVKGRSPLPDERLAQVEPTLRAIFDSISPVNTTSQSTAPNGSAPNGTASNNQGTSGQNSNPNKSAFHLLQCLPGSPFENLNVCRQGR
ncbi:hypothetical protein BJ165DRAFT_1344083 [Panaeolus papilionaceus]|nr:hypothetical protein BJ165DRAFT_1344083 [Panaeolus papilionaceus]